MNFEPMYDGTRVNCSKLVWQLGRSQPRLCWIFQHRKIAGRESRGYCAPTSWRLLAAWPAVNHLRCAEAHGLNSLLKKIRDRLQQWAVGNVNARPMHTKELVANDLVNNIAHGVRWHHATTVLEELGCNLFLEMPLGHTLSDLVRENLRGINSIPVEAGLLPGILCVAQQEEVNT
jgi:hypothetical protein